MRFAADENFNGQLLRGLQARLPNLDVVRVQDTVMYTAPDTDLLEWLAREGRILLTHDVETIPGFANRRVEQGLAMPGVIIVRETATPGKLIDDLEVYIEAGSSSDFDSLVVYLP